MPKTIAKMKSRCSNGSTLPLAAAALLLLALVTMYGVHLVLHIGTAAYYKDKLQFIADQAAAHAAGELSWADSPRAGANVDQASAKTRKLVEELLSEMGFPPPEQIEVTADSDKATVTLNVKGLVMPRSSSPLPAFIELRAVGEKFFAEDRPAYTLSISVDNRAGTMVVVPALTSNFRVLFDTYTSASFDFRHKNTFNHDKPRPPMGVALHTLSNLFGKRP
jgi:hypothetical protein